MEADLKPRETREETPMRKSQYSQEQVGMALRQAEAGTPVAEICRKLRISEQTFYRWKKKFGGLGIPELRELRQLREENRKLKGLVADLSLDGTILRGALRKKGEAGVSAGGGGVGAFGVSGERTPGVPGGTGPAWPSP